MSLRRATRGFRGFSLLELALGATMILAITAVAMGVMVSVQSVQRDAQAKVAITRDAQFTLDMLARDLQFVGTNVPRGNEIYQNSPLASSRRLRPPLRIGRSDYLAFIGDLPYPNADVNGSMILQNAGNPTAPCNPAIGPCPTPAAALRSLHVASELALCTPPITPPGSPAPGYSCRTGQNRLIDVGSTADCGNANAGSAATCPWSLGKWQGTDGSDQFPVHLVISTPAGTWVRREAISFENLYGGAVSVRLNAAYPSGTNAGGSSSVPPGASPRSARGDLDPNDFVMRRAGASLIGQLDRVFYSLETLAGAPCGGGSDCVLRRRQCWAWPNSLSPTDADFPDVGGAPIPSSTTAITGCAPPNEGTPWETVMHGISSLRIRYFASSNPDVELIAPLNADEAADVMFTEVSVELSRRLPAVTGGVPTILRQSFTRRVFMEDSGGAFIDSVNPRLATGAVPPGNPTNANDVAPANGGCATELSCGRH